MGVTATEFRVLGPVQALSEGRLLPLGGPKQRALLAELLLHGGAVLPRDHLVDALWDDPPSSARASLQVYVHGLRRAIGTERIETHGDGYRIQLEPAELDLARFERLVGKAERASRSSGSSQGLRFRSSSARSCATTPVSRRRRSRSPHAGSGCRLPRPRSSAVGSRSPPSKRCCDATTCGS